MPECRCIVYGWHYTRLVELPHLFWLEVSESTKGYVHLSRFLDCPLYIFFLSHLFIKGDPQELSRVGWLDDLAVYKNLPFTMFTLAVS